MENQLEEDQFRLSQYNKVRWNTKQNGFIYRDKLRAKIQTKFQFCLLKKFRQSIFGTYLHEFNYQQCLDKNKNEDKLAITDFDLVHGINKNSAPNILNQLFDNEVELLRDAVATTDRIDMNFMYEKLDNLRINNCFFSKMDTAIKPFENLMVLILSGNNLTQLNARILPRKLIFLELFDNALTSVASLIQNPPKKLMYLGLGRNKLSNNSQLHLLAESKRFKYLCSLDLSDNDIYSLQDVAVAIAGLQTLNSLQLNGNPCSVHPDYKTVVVKVLPGLKYLDCTAFLDKDKEILQDNNKNDKDGIKNDSNGKAQLIFYCYRIMGLKKPPREKKVNQTIHVEITLPLLEPIHVETPDETLEYLAEDNKSQISVLSKSPNKSRNKSRRGSKSGGKKSKKSSRIKVENIIDEKSIYNSDKTYNPKYKNYSFRTAAKPWSRLIEFDPVTIDCPNDNWKLISDSLKTCVNVRVIYLKSSKNLRSKKTVKRDKKKSKTSTKKKQKVTSKTQEKAAPKSSSTINGNAGNTDNIDTVLQRVTLANFYCALTDVNWSDRSIDFYWADHPDANPNAILVDGSLGAIKYADRKGARAAKKAKKALKTGKMSAVVTTPDPILFPQIFTCQIGFGLKRNYLQ